MKTIELNFKEKLILLFASITLIASAGFLITFEKFQTTNNDALIPLGKVQSKHKLLKRKNIEGMIWEDLENNKEVYLGDKIFTSDGSHAILQVGKNSFVEMSPLTLIQLKETSKRALQIELQDGSLKAKLDKDDLQSLQTKSGEIDLNSSNSNLIIDQTKGTGSIVVLAGAVLLKNKSGQQELKENQAAKFTSNHISTPGKIDYLPISPSSKNPTPLSSLKSVNFKWKKITKTQEKKIIEIANDGEFKQIIKKIINEQDHESIDLSTLSQGTYFWRIKSISKELGSHGSQKFVIFNDLPPKLITPVEGYSQFLPINSIKNLEFQWEDISALNYQFETNFTPSESKESQYQKLTNTNKIEIKLNKNGNFWWRVRGIFGAHTGPWSEKKFFKIHDQELPLKPINLGPANGISLEPESHRIQFKWKGSALYPYKFVLSKDASFKEIIHETVVKEGYYDWTIQQTGQFFWKVSSSQESESSDVWNFSIYNPIFKELSPIDNERLTLKSKKQNVELKWSVLSRSGISLKGPRIIILYKDNKEIQRQETISDQVNFEISEVGKYQWRIIYFNQQSDLFKFEMFNIPALEAPKIKDEIRSKIKKKKKLVLFN